MSLTSYDFEDKLGDLKDYPQPMPERECLKIYLLCSYQWSKSSVEKEKNFGSIFSDTMVFDSQEKIQLCKPKIKEDCINFLDCPFECDFSLVDLQKLLSSMSASLLCFKVNDMMNDVKLQFESLEDNLNMYEEDLLFAVYRCSDEDYKHLKIHVGAWASRLACILLLCWVLEGKNEILETKMDLLSDLQGKISSIHVDIIMKGLSFRGNPLEDPILTTEIKDKIFFCELKNLKIYMLCLAKWENSPFAEDKNFGFVEDFDRESALEEAARKCRISKWDSSEFLKVIDQHFKPKITEDCLDFLYCPFMCKFSRDELLDFMMYISSSLQNLLHLKADFMMIDLKVKILSLKENLDFFREVFEFTTKRCSRFGDLNDFKIHIEAWAWGVVCLSLVYWAIDVKQENNMAQRMEIVLSDLQKQISPSNLGVTKMYLAMLKASKPSSDCSFMVGKLVTKFFELLKENFQVDPEKDDIQMLFIELMFLITFLMDRPEEEKLEEGKLIASQADSLLNEAAFLISLLSSGDFKEGISEERNFLLHTFLKKANAVKAQVRKIYTHLFPGISSFNFPRINVLGFFYSLLENLEEFSVHFPNHQILMLREELVSLKNSNLKYIFILEFQKKHKDVKDLWTRIVNMIYNAERVVSSFIHIKESLWHDILCLSDVIDEVKLIKGEMKRIQDQCMYDSHALNFQTCPTPLVPLQANNGPIVDNVFVGFKDEVKEIVGRLTSESAKLHVISIIGMPGLGKTTLAKKVYSDAQVQRHFHKRAWCTVSQEFDNKRFLVDILRDLAGCDGEFLDIKEEDLAQILYKELKGQRYLIVLDDIWHIKAWNALKLSFPDDNKGSRIMFTSRIHNLISETESGYSPFHLNSLSDEHSWELLEKKLFGKDSCPKNFVDIGKKIAKKCKGVPLPIVLIAGILKEKIESLDWWKHVEESPDLLKEGFSEIIELSYKHLPEYLKPCFLYFGLFPEDKEIRVKKLTLLWISEGLIPKNEFKSLEALAAEYFMDLVSKSLVIVTKRSSTGRVKAFCIHDLLHEFSIRKGEEVKFGKVILSSDFTYSHYRLCIQSQYWLKILKLAPPLSSVHSLLSHHLFPSISGHSKYYKKLCQNISSFKYLQVLDLTLDLTIDALLESITLLVLLRYLAIVTDHHASLVVPPSIKRLKNLETFSFHIQSGGYGEFDLPITMWEMSNLRHVSLHARIPSGFCDNILPLENIQSFSFPQLWYREEELFLRSIPNVRRLKCLFLLSSNDDPIEHLKFDFLSHLESLFIYSYAVLDSCAFYFPFTLKKLTIKDFGLPWTEISQISKLPNLEVLKIDGGFRGTTWKVENEEFLKLKCLVLKWLNLERLDASDGSFQCLERLEVENCAELEEIPSRVGSIFTLKMIRIKNCRSIINDSVRKIQEEQADIGQEHLEVFLSRPIAETYSDSDSDS